MNLYQRSEEWQKQRCGKFTASRIKNINAKEKKGKALNATLTEILTERLTGKVKNNFTSQAMQWGIDNEPHAIIAYENETGEFVVGTGFTPHPTIAMSGASPDGLVGDDGLIEVKCPTSETHTNTLITAEIPSEYIPQITWQLACTGRKWCDFVSYDPRMQDPNLQLKIIRVHADDLEIEELEEEVRTCERLLTKIFNVLTKQEQTNEQDQKTKSTH